MNKRSFLHVAVLHKAHGVLGELRAELLSEHPDRLLELKELYLLNPQQELLRPVKIKARRSVPGFIVSLEGIDDREAAQKLLGHYLSLKREDARALPEGRYYITELEGLQVLDETRGQIGILHEVLQNSPQDIFLVRRPAQPDLLIPVSRETFLGADLARQEAYVRLPEGLWEIYE